MSVAARGAPEESIAALARAVADDAVRLAKAEIEVAKAQAVTSLKRVAAAAGLLAGAAMAGLFMLIFALGSVPTALADHLLPGWAWWLVVAGLFLVAAAFLALLGIRSLRGGIGGGRRLIGELKEDVAWLKRLTRRSASGS